VQHHSYMPLASISSHHPAHAQPVTGTLPPTPHADAAATAGTDMVGGKQGSITSETLDNGVRIIIAERPGAASTKIQVGIGAGSMQDPDGKLGAAHLLEHLAFEGSPSMTGPQQQDLRAKLGGNWNAYTNQQSVVYYGIVPKQDSETGAKLLGDMFRNPNLSADAVRQERAAVQNEILRRRAMGIDSYEVLNRVIYGNSPLANNIIGTAKSVDAVTSKDLKAYHQNYFTGRNTVVLVEGDRRHLPLDAIRSQLGALPAGARVDHSGEQLQVRPGRQIQQVTGDDTDAVEIKVALPFAREAFEKIDPLHRRLVQSSLNDVLHERMRRFNDLTYGTSARFSLDDTANGALLLMETTVAPDAVRAATRDLLSIAEDARDGFGPKTLSEHKGSFVAWMRQSEPNLDAPKVDVSSAAEAAFDRALREPGVSIPALEPSKPRSARAQNEALAKEIRRMQAVTGAQFAKAAEQLISLDDFKVMVVGDAKLSDIRAGIRDAGIDSRGVQVLDPVERRA
jgi:predicted Zn-dependent peptidase